MNLSFRQFQDSQLLPTLQHLIAGSTVDAQWLEFELTETAVMSRSDYVLKTMQTLGELGARFSLDDFGTGFSSFSHLANLPIAVLKVDKSFVTGMVDHIEQRQMVKAIINLAHSLNLEVVAEGVENASVLALLHELKCDEGQGYHMSRPLPVAQFCDWVARWQARPPASARGLALRCGGSPPRLWRSHCPLPASQASGGSSTST